MQTFSPEIAHAKNYNRWILSLFQEHIHGNCLEIGVAHGNFIDLLPKTIRYVGLDIEPCYVEEVQKRGVEAFVADISDSDLLAKVKEKWVDCILCFNVLEHIAEDAKALGNLTYLLRRGGICAFFFLLSLFYSRKWTHWRDIIRRYTKTSLRALVANLPLKVVKMEYFNVIGGIGWWINKYIRKESLNDSAINIQIKIFDKYIVPFSKRLQPLARHLFGQSLACILRKV